MPLLSDEINRGVKDTTNKSDAFGTLHVICKIKGNRACLQEDRFESEASAKLYSACRCFLAESTATPTALLVKNCVFRTLHVIYKIKGNRACLQADRLDYP